MQWYRVDLHIHTPGSADYSDPKSSYIDILRKAELRGIDILAFTDHNTVRGYAAMMHEIEQLEYLEQLGRANGDELRTLAEYRRLLDKILVLPGFEFTATFGFHILGIFSPDTQIHYLNHLLLSLNIPSDALEIGSSEVGASSDVLTAYHMINEAGGICIAAHANTSHGVAMRGLDFGGQTRIAYTQDRHLHALEVTDLERGGRRSTAKFFDGTKPEYPRRMRCIQGSDSHAVNTIRDRNNRITTLGVGERVTEVSLPERSFPALLQMFQSNDFSRSRPYSPNHKPEDFVQSAREEGPSVVQSFHESMEHRGGRLYSIVADVCAFANTNGGTIYIGISPNKKKPAVGIDNPQEKISTLQNEINNLITPTLKVDIDTNETQNKTILRVQVPFGEERPYAVENYKIYVRDDSETTQAIRDEIVNLARQGMVFQETASSAAESPAVASVASVAALDPAAASGAMAAGNKAKPAKDSGSKGSDAPRAGVEIVGEENRNGQTFYIMRDLRNGNVVKNVTRSSARRLWHYAIKQRQANDVKSDKIQWSGDKGLLRRYKKAGNLRYDLVQKENGSIRVYYGVTENGMHGDWQQFIEDDET